VIFESRRVTPNFLHLRLASALGSPDVAPRRLRIFSRLLGIMRPTYFREPPKPVATAELCAPGINSREEVLRGIAHELDLVHGVVSMVHNGAVILKVGHLAVGCGTFDGTWGAVAVDEQGRRIALWEGDFMAFADRDITACGHIPLTHAFLASIRSIRSASPDDYLQFLLSQELTAAGGYWTHGRERCYISPSLDLGLVDDLIRKVTILVTHGSFAGIESEDLKWLLKTCAGIRRWRNLSDVRAVMNFLTGLNDIVHAHHLPASTYTVRQTLKGLLDGLVLPSPMGEGPRNRIAVTSRNTEQA